MIVQVEGATRPVHRLMEEFAAVRLHFKWFGIKRALTETANDMAAETFAANGKFLSSSKKLLDTKDETYRKLTKIKSESRKQWKLMTLPYPEDGVRLIRIDDIRGVDRQMGFEQWMEEAQRELAAAVDELDARRPELIAAARENLGALFDELEYPPTFQGQFELTWDYPNLKPPEYLRGVSPDVYEAQARRMEAQLREAADMAEQAFLAEFVGMVDHLKERLEPGEDGRPKKFHASSFANLQEFFDRFTHLNIGCSADVERLVEEARELLSEVDPGTVRDSKSLRENIREGMSGISQQLAGFVGALPRRTFG